MGDEGEGRRLRPLMAALLMPLLALVVAGGYGLHAKLASSGTGGGDGPPARSGAAMAYDAAHGVVIMFGGQGGSGVTYDDTWTWDGGSWTEQRPKLSPPSGQGAVMAADPNTGRVLLVTGWNNGYLGAAPAETWSWDGSNWRREHPAHEVQGMPEGMASDPATHQVVLVTQGPPRPAPPPTPMPTPPPAPPGEPGVLVMPTPMRPMPLTRQTWTWNGSDWTLRDTLDDGFGMPAARLAWDARSHSVMLVTVHSGCAMAFAEGGAATAVVPRVVQVPPPAPSLAPAATPRAALTPHAAPIDPLRTPGPASVAPAPPPFVHPPVIIGGTPPIPCGDVVGTAGGGAATSVAPRSTMSAWNGSAWHAVAATKLPVLVPPPAVSDDPSSGGLLVGAMDGWWTVAGGTATMHTDVAFRWRSGAALAGDPGRGEVVLFGGTGPGGFGADTWTWDGSIWTHRAGPLLVQPSPHVVYGVPEAPQPVQVNPALPAPLPGHPGVEP